MNLSWKNFAKDSVLLCPNPQLQQHCIILRDFIYKTVLWTIIPRKYWSHVCICHARYLFSFYSMIFHWKSANFMNWKLQVEEFNVSISQFVANIMGDREKASDIILNNELLLMQQLNYNLTVHNPFRPVEGLLIDIKVWNLRYYLQCHNWKY